MHATTVLDMSVGCTRLDGLTQPLRGCHKTARADKADQMKRWREDLEAFKRDWPDIAATVGCEGREEKPLPSNWRHEQTE